MSKKKKIEFIHIPKCAGTSIRKTLGIQTAGHRPVRKTNHTEDKFLFSFVRNPFDRLASLYRWQYRRNIYSIKSEDISFQRWFMLTVVTETKPYFYNPDYWKPCSWWLKDDEGNLGVHFVGKVELIDKDWKKLHDIFKSGGVDIPEQLPVENTTEKKNETYTPEMIEIMVEKYKQDLINWYPEILEEYVT